MQIEVPCILCLPELGKGISNENMDHQRINFFPRGPIFGNRFHLNSIEASDAVSGIDQFLFILSR